MKAFGRKRKHSKSGLAWTRKEILPQTGGDAENQTRSSTDYSRNFSVSEQMQLCSRSSWTSFVSLWKSANSSNATFFARHCNKHNVVIPMFPTLVGYLVPGEVRYGGRPQPPEAGTSQNPLRHFCLPPTSLLPSSQLQLNQALWEVFFQQPVFPIELQKQQMPEECISALGNCSTRSRGLKLPIIGWHILHRPVRS